MVAKVRPLGRGDPQTILTASAKAVRAARMEWNIGRQSHAVTWGYMELHAPTPVIVASYRQSGQDLGKRGPEPWAGLCCPSD